MIKLLFKNKITEIANFLYYMWKGDLVDKYIAFIIVTVIPLTSIVAYLLYLDDPTHLLPVYIVVGMTYYVFFTALIGITYVLLKIFINWIKSNIELAKKGIVIKPRWK